MPLLLHACWRSPALCRLIPLLSRRLQVGAELGLGWQLGTAPRGWGRGGDPKIYLLCGAQAPSKPPLHQASLALGSLLPRSVQDSPSPGAGWKPQVHLLFALLFEAPNALSFVMLAEALLRCDTIDGGSLGVGPHCPGEICGLEVIAARARSNPRRR